MGKDKKSKKDEDVVEEEEERGRKKDKFPNVVGDSRDYIVKILNRVEKAPWTHERFETIIDVVKTKRDKMVQEGRLDRAIDQLIEQLEEFVGDKNDPRKVAEFKNYDQKFTHAYGYTK